MMLAATAMSQSERQRFISRGLPRSSLAHLAGDALRYEAIDGPEEGGQRLSGTRGGQDEGMLAAPDGRPSQRLGRRGLPEALPEPGPQRRGEGPQD